MLSSPETRASAPRRSLRPSELERFAGKQPTCSVENCWGNGRSTKIHWKSTPGTYRARTLRLQCLAADSRRGILLCLRAGSARAGRRGAGGPGAGFRDGRSRRRALWALLFPRLLARRHRYAHGRARPSRPQRPGPATLSELTGGYTRYVASGEINSHVDDVPAKLDEAEAAWTQPGVGTDRLDVLTVTLGDACWFNLRPSSAEPCSASTSKQPVGTR